MLGVLLNIGSPSPLILPKLILKAPAPVLLKPTIDKQHTAYPTPYSYYRNGTTSHGTILAMPQMPPPEQILSKRAMQDLPSPCVWGMHYEEAVEGSRLCVFRVSEVVVWVKRTHSSAMYVEVHASSFFIIVLRSLIEKG